MNRPGLLQGVFVAGGLALIASILVAALSVSLGTVAAFRWVIAGVSLAYIAYLLSQSEVRTGRVTAVVLTTSRCRTLCS